MKQFDVFISERLKLNKDSKISKHNFKPFKISANARECFVEIFGCMTGYLETDDFEQQKYDEVAKNYTKEEMNIISDLYSLFCNEIDYPTIYSRMLDNTEIMLIKNLLMDLDEKDMLASDLYSLWDDLEIE
jgi:hypothetical protein